jgi:hypothetical protein
MPSIDDGCLRTNLFFELERGDDKRLKKLKIGDVEPSDMETVSQVMKALFGDHQPMPLL